MKKGNRYGRIHQSIKRAARRAESAGGRSARAGERGRGGLQHRNVQVKKGDVPGFGRMLDRFQREWGAALDAAKRQDNAKKICVEETKLEALADVRARFEELGCE